MTSWRPLVAGTVALFLIVLAFLAGQMRAGADPALRRAAVTRNSPAQTQSQPQTQTDPAQPGFGSGQGHGGDDGGYGDDGSVPTVPSPDVAPPTTHQS